jgi:DNA sulfur modification protein DndB
MSRISTKALVCEQNGKHFYVAIMSSKYLKEMCFVSRKREDSKKGFQRLLNKERAKKIAAYLDEEKGVIPPALILSAQKSTKLKYDSKTLELSLECVEKSLLVLDGQHRLFGLTFSSHEYDVPVVIFDHLFPQDEIRQFIDINTTQKGVPAALLLDIKAQAGTETPTEERQRKMFDMLNKDSVLSGMFSPSESVSGKISRPAFNEATKTIFEGGPISSRTDEVIYSALKNYLEVIDRILKKLENADAKLTKNVVFKAVMMQFNDVFEKCFAQFSNFKVKSIEQYLEPLEDMDPSVFAGSNKVTIQKISAEMKRLMMDNINLDGDIF